MDASTTPPDAATEVPDAAPPPCDGPGEQMCGAVCADTTVDPDHCGSCDNVCSANQTCTSSICACDAPFITCMAGGDNLCVDAATDPQHCGGCGNDCLIGVECISGVCAPCDAPRVVCGDACADLTTSTDHCGACGNDCVPGATCVTDGAGTRCECPASDPVACESGCSDLTTDPNNCGACGNVCPTGSTCDMVGGTAACVCSDPAEVACNSGCTSLATDPNNCGECGNSCGDGASCISGGCVCPVAGETHCGRLGCVDLQTNNDACGSCGNDCRDGLEACTTGSCTCAPGVEFCPGIGGGGTACTDILSDPRDCGTTCGAADGNNCANDEYCSGGACVCRPGYTDIAGQCIDTLTNPLACGPVGGPTTPCDPGDRCEDGVCVADCSPGLAVCLGLGPVDSATCVDLNSDPRHCGECDNPCDENEVCAGGQCRNYRTTGDCTSCPCDRCGEVFDGDGSCCEHGTDPICVDAPVCP